jgi:hypothetical protein
MIAQAARTPSAAFIARLTVLSLLFLGRRAAQ